MLNNIKRVANYFPCCLTIVDVKSAGRPCIFTNDKFLENTGYNSEEAIGRNLSYLQGELTAVDSIEFMRRCFDQKLACIQDLVNYKKDGTPFLNRLLMLPFGRESESLFYLGFQNDITTKSGFKHNNDSLSKVNDGEIRHAVNNPLSVILGTFEMYRHRVMTENEMEQLALSISNFFERINDFSLNIDTVSEFEKFEALTDF